MITRKEFSRRRKQLMRMMGKNAIAIIPTATEQLRNRDVEYPFRASESQEIHPLVLIQTSLSPDCGISTSY